MTILRKIISHKLSAAVGGVAMAVAGSMAFMGVSVAESNQKILNEKAVIEILRAEVARDPTFILEALNSHVEKQQALEQLKLDSKASEVRDEMARSEGRPFVGSKDGAVELVYFFDINCGYCKRLEPVIKRIVEDNQDVRVSHREIPILSESSRSAGVASHIVWQMFPDKYEALHESFVGHQGALSDDIIEAKMIEVLGSSDAEKVISEASNPNSDVVKKAVSFLEENLELAQRAGVTGTPFVYVLQGDALMRGAGDDAYEKLTGFIEAGRVK